MRIAWYGEAAKQSVRPIASVAQAARNPQAEFSPIAQAIEFIRAGRLRGLAVTGATASAALPEFPTVAAFVPGYEAYVWNGIGTPRSTPATIVVELNKAINVALADPDIAARLADLGAEPMPMTPAEFGQLIASETEKWANAIRTVGIKPD
jgi:tripartite-type tricarboxylate transporter receptor subunit TctC